MDTTHFTAWLVNDPSALDQPCMDVAILEDALIGADPEDKRAWATDSSKPEAFRAVTTVDAREGEVKDAISEAEDLMEGAGWRVIGDWDSVPNAYVATVVRV